MGQIFEVPFNSGQDEGTDRALLPDTLLRSARNCRLARDGRLEVRTSFTALSTATYSTGTLVAYDVTNFKGRLLALGDQAGLSRATDLFEWNAARSKWRATSGNDVNASSAARLPRLTDIRAVGQLPDLPESVTTIGLAAGAGYVCAAYERLGATQTVVHVFDPATDQSLLIETLAIRRPQVVYLSPYFWIVGVDSDEDIVGCRFDPTSDETIPAVSTLVSNATVVVDLAAKIMGSNFATCYATATSAIVHTWSVAGVQQQTWTAFASSTQSVALASNGAGSLLSVARQDAAAIYSLSTFSAAGALQNGPTALFGGAGGSGIRVGMELETTSLAIVGVDYLNGRALFQSVTQSTHSAGSAEFYYDAVPQGAPVLCGTDVFLGFTDMAATGDVGTYHIVDRDNFLPQCFVGAQLNRFTTSSSNVLSYMAADGTKLYFAVITVSQDGGNFNGVKFRATVYEAETVGTGRRQMAQVGGELLIAGGLPLTYDGRTMVEQGFAERPVISSAAQGTVGALSLLGVYNAVPVWEVFDSGNRLLRSQAGSPFAVTLTGANDSITWTVTTPHSLRRHPSFADQGQTIRVSVYRSEAGEGVFFLDSQVTIDTADLVAEPVTVVSTASDVQISDNLVLYEQSQTPISHVSPGPYTYVHPWRERALSAGRPEAESWGASKLLFPAEPLEWAPLGQLGYSGRVGQPIVAVGAFETVGIVWTEQEIWTIPGRGPERNGVGEFDAATGVATPGGAIDWRSVLVTPPGAFFQMRSDRLMLLDRSGAVTWAGSPVQDTLELFPEIVGVVFVRQLDQVVFACNNSLGTLGVFLVYDLSAAQWFVDTLATPISSVSELDGRLVYVAAGAVLQQNATVGSGAGALPAFRIDTGSFRPFYALGYGDVVRIGILGTYLGDATVDVSISYDDGKTWTSMGSQAVTAAAWTNADTGAAIAAGDPVTLLYAPARRSTDRFAIRVEQSAATNTGGIRLHVLSFEVEAQSGTVRRAARDHR